MLRDLGVDEGELLEDSVAMLAVPFFVGAVAEVHDEVAVPDAQAGRHAEQVEIAVAEPHSLIASM